MFFCMVITQSARFFARTLHLFTAKYYTIVVKFIVRNFPRISSFYFSFLLSLQKPKIAKKRRDTTQSEIFKTVAFPHKYSKNLS